MGAETLKVEGSATKRCPYCAEEVRVEAVKCRHCGSHIGTDVLQRAVRTTWYRSRGGKAVAGVCMGLSKQFNISATIVRLAFILGTLVAGWAIVIYLALWFIMPYDEEEYGDERFHPQRRMEDEDVRGAGPPG